VIFYPPGETSSFNLQSTLAASSALTSQIMGHHPISCKDDLWFHDDGTLACPHAQVEADDSRTQFCLDHSIAILLIEMLREREDADAGR